MSEGSNCKWCSLALDNWVYSQLENNSHLLRGVTRLIRRKRTATIKFLKKDLADLVSNGLDANTYSRAGGLLDELRHLWNLDFIEQTCDFVYKQLSTMQKIGLTKGERLNKVLDHPAFQADPIGSKRSIVSSLTKLWLSSKLHMHFIILNSMSKLMMIYTLRPDRLSLLLAKERSHSLTYLGCLKKGPVFTDPKLKC